MSAHMLQSLIMGLPVLLFSLVVHEVAHALVAYWLGDDTAYRLGRVTLNPLPHLDPMMSLLLPAMCIVFGMPIFGGAKPVPVNMNRFRHPMRDMALVAAAGPLSNVILALLGGILMRLLLRLLYGTGFWIPELAQLLSTFIFINLLLAAFNLIPIPPLDGSRILVVILKGEFRYSYMRLERYGMMILMAILFLGRSILMDYLNFSIGLLSALTGTQSMFN